MPTPSGFHIGLFDIEFLDLPQGMAGAIYSDAQKAVAHAFANARKDAGMKQIDLAAAIGKHQSYISDIERGQRRIDVLEALVIARGMGIDPTEFYQKLIQHVPEKITI